MFVLNLTEIGQLILEKLLFHFYSFAIASPKRPPFQTNFPNSLIILHTAMVFVSNPMF
jgi:hypothetical protein